MQIHVLIINLFYSKFIRKFYAFIFFLLCASTVMAAGKQYPELIDKIAPAVDTILIKHGLPVQRDRASPWFGVTGTADAWIGRGPYYTLYFYRANEISSAAQIEIIQYCMNLYNTLDRKVTLRIEMRTESRKPGYPRPKPFFELTLNNMN